MLKQSILLALAVLTSFQVQARIHVNTKAVASSIVFIYAPIEAGGVDQNKSMGTGFIVNIPVLHDPKRGYMVLITARHVIEPEWAGCRTANPTQVYLRLNKTSSDPSRDVSGVGFVPVPLIANGKSRIKVPSDNDIDVAAVALHPNSFAGYEIPGIPINEFASIEEMNLLSVGDDITAAGLIPGIPGANRNYPFFKFGKISNPTEELVPAACGEGTLPIKRKYWFIALNQVQGNSGAPVIAYPSSPAGGLIGSSGIKEIERPVVIGVQSISLIQADLAGMTPIRYVLEAIRKLGLANADLDATAPTPVPGAK